MARAASARQYGKPSKRTKSERLFAELPQSPVRKPPPATVDDPVGCLTSRLSVIHLQPESEPDPEPKPRRKSTRKAPKQAPIDAEEEDVQAIALKEEDDTPQLVNTTEAATTIECTAVEDVAKEVTPEDTLSTTSDDATPQAIAEGEVEVETVETELQSQTPLRTLTWVDVCPPGDQIDKIAEASYAEVYRVTNERGISIIKVIRLESPIKAQTKAQVRSGLVDEEPHSDEDIDGELQISEWLADIPGFVVYKEKYVIQGKTTRQLLETHQAFQKKMKRQDPGRAQFYPSPSRYLDETRFLVVELGDAGKALEDWELTSEHQIWDIFFLEAVALARAEEIAMFEHRDLHEGNICIKQVRPPRDKEARSDTFFGYSGLEITILDYGLSRAEDLSIDYAKPVAFDLEKDLSLFTSTHASQCKVYRQMRSFLLRADRKCLPPEAHDTPYAKGSDGPLSWDVYAPYSNVLWLAYLYEYLVSNFKGGKKELMGFKKETSELWMYLNPEAAESVPCFGCAADVVCFAVESGWINEGQLLGSSASMLDREDSIIISREDGDHDASLRRSPRRRQTRLIGEMGETENGL